MARTFDTVSDTIFTGPGLLTGALGPVTVAAIVRRNTDSSSGVWRLITTLHTSGTPGTARFGFGFEDTSNSIAIHNGTSGSIGIPTTASDGWVMVAATKATGTVAARMHRYKYSTAAHTHTAGTGTMANSTGVTGTGVNKFSQWAATEYGGMEMAVVGFWLSVLSDDQIESLAYSRAAWLANSPAHVWIFDQASTGQALLDITGNGANQTSITGTTVSTVSVPLWSYGAPVLPVITSPPAGVSGTLDGTLGPLTGSISGTVTDSGSLAGTLPILTGSISGTVTDAGTLSGTLGPLTGSISGTVTDSGGLAGTLPILTGALAAAVQATATLVGTLPTLTGSGFGTVTDPGTLAGTLGPLTGALSGTVTDSGTLAGTLPPLTGTLAGAATSSGVLAGALGPLVGAFTGTAGDVSGALTGTLPTLTGSWVGTLPVIRGIHAVVNGMGLSGSSPDGPAARRHARGVSARRAVSGPVPDATSVGGPASGTGTEVSGLNVSRDVTGPAARRIVTGIGV